jgi:hypothetical protein
MSRALVFLSFGFAFAAPLVARAESPPAAPNPPLPAVDPTPERIWYGAELLVFDAGTFVLTGAAAAVDTQAPVAWVLGGLITYIASGPVIHLLNGNASGAGLSVLMRVGIPFLAGAAGYALAPCSPPSSYDAPSEETAAWNCTWTRVGAAGLGGILGILTASALDAGFLAWKSGDTAPSPDAATLHALAWLPSAGIAYDSGHRATPTFGVQGTF